MPSQLPRTPTEPWERLPSGQERWGVAGHSAPRATPPAQLRTRHTEGEQSKYCLHMKNQGPVQPPDGTEKSGHVCQEPSGELG